MNDTSIKHHTPEFPCTECGKDAFIAYSGGKNGDGWDGLVKKGERLCTSCFIKRGGRNFFGGDKHP